MMDILTLLFSVTIAFWKLKQKYTNLCIWCLWQFTIVFSNSTLNFKPEHFKAFTLQSLVISKHILIFMKSFSLRLFLLNILFKKVTARFY